MNMDKLKIANDAIKNIKEIEKQIEVLENSYCNSILGWDYSRPNNVYGKQVSFTLDGELRDIVIKFKKEELSKFTAEFEQI
jgi:hypothetical protein